MTETSIIWPVITGLLYNCKHDFKPGKFYTT